MAQTQENLIEDTIRKLQRIGKEPYDIERIGSFCGTYGCTWEEYKQLADFDYSAGYGSTKVATDLIILFRDGTWLERDEYDGSEWWTHCAPPPHLSMWDNPKQINSLQGTMRTLEHIHEEGEEQE